MATSRPPRAGYHSVKPRIVVADVAGQVDWLRAVLGATGDVRAGRPAEIRIGDSLVMVTPTTEREPFAAFLHVSSTTPMSPSSGRCEPDRRCSKRRWTRRTATGAPWWPTPSATSSRSPTRSPTPDCSPSHPVVHPERGRCRRSDSCVRCALTTCGEVADLVGAPMRRVLVPAPTAPRSGRELAKIPSLWRRRLGVWARMVVRSHGGAGSGPSERECSWLPSALPLPAPSRRERQSAGPFSWSAG